MFIRLDSTLTYFTVTDDNCDERFPPVVHQTTLKKTQKSVSYMKGIQLDIFLFRANDVFYGKKRNRGYCTFNITHTDIMRIINNSKRSIPAY